MIRTRLIGSSIAAAAIASLSLATAQADGPQAVATAAQHARLAAGSAAINAVHLHLHHVLNCLVGPDGEGFDEDSGNPCAATGGAIPQTSDSEMKAELEELAEQVRGGIANQDLAAAQETATEVHEMLAEDE